MKSSYDVVVVGAGPAGSTAARFASEKGASVLLLERDREIGVPVRCAEATSFKHLYNYVDVREEWIANRINKIRLVSPAGKYVDLDLPFECGILNRRIFDHDLAALAAKSGSEVFTKANVTNVKFEVGKLPVVEIIHIGQKKLVEAKIVIAADGVESRIARCAGIRTQTKLVDIEPCAQMVMEDIDVDGDRIDFYFGLNLAPGGYVWIFPKSDSCANVGLGFNAAMSNGKTALTLLKEFYSEHFPNGKCLTTIAGGVPVANSLKTLVTDNFMVVGDAAHQVNPLSGGGILSVMSGGKKAGTVAANAIQKGDFSQKFLNNYSRDWNKTVGKEHERYYRIKEYVINMVDKDFDELAEFLSGIDPKKMTFLTLFKQAVRKKPSLILDAVKLFTNIS